MLIRKRLDGKNTLNLFVNTFSIVLVKILQEIQVTEPNSQVQNFIEVSCNFQCAFANAKAYVLPPSIPVPVHIHFPIHFCDQINMLNFSIEVHFSHTIKTHL